MSAAPGGAAIGSSRSAPGAVSTPVSSLAGRLSRDDATIRALWFVDAEYGWAVGDRGVIRHTRDGGRTWSEQEAGVRCALYDVFFLDRSRGWIVGGAVEPFTLRSSGVVLLTRDGGLNWQRAPSQSLPMLRHVRLADGRRGWAAGCTSAMYPSGVFRSEDGGLSWTPIPGDGPHGGWTAADLAPVAGLLAGPGGFSARIEAGALGPSRWTDAELRRPAAIRALGLSRACLVGDGGLVLQTQDAGATWNAPPPGVLEPDARQFDFAALAVHGSNVWIAGSPGTLIFHSADAGRTWAPQPTGCAAPLGALCFVDSQHGWAAGSLGTILATTDGGRSWNVVRSGGSRAALLGVFARIDDVPAELISQLCAEEGYLGVVEVIGRGDLEVEPAAATSERDRLAEAAVALGACDSRLAWSFPLRQRGLEFDAAAVVELWNRAHGGDGLETAEAELVRRIRTWRPSVVVTHQAVATAGRGDAALVGRLVLRAVESAADPTRFPEQLGAAGLRPWEVAKVYGLVAPGEKGDVLLPAAQWAPRLGASLADWSTMPRGLLDDGHGEKPASLAFDLLRSRTGQLGAGRDFFAAVALKPGGEARRALVEPASSVLESFRQAATKRRNVEAILARMEQSGQGGRELLAQVGELTYGLDDAGAAAILFDLGGRYRRLGEWDLAAEVFRLLADRYPGQPLAPVAMEWLMSCYASEEVGHRTGADRARPPATPGGGTGSSAPRRRAERAVAAGEMLFRLRPETFAEPRPRFALAAAQRALGQTAAADRFFATYGRSAARGAWRACAEGEQWLAGPRAAPAPKNTLHCPATGARPRLDGQLDDAVWQHAGVAVLRSPLGDDAEWPSVVMLAHDGEFLYVAARCRRPGAPVEEPPTGPRTRDPDLSRRDRVEILLDIDRDHGTFYRLVVDDRGWAAEDCWGDATWNPSWFVAAARELDTWTVEAAVPLAELVAEPPSARAAWAVGLQRIVPGTGFQSWTVPAAIVARGEGFGYLIFE